MESLLAERPLLLSLMVGGMAALLLYSWLQVGNKKLGVAGLLCALFVPVIWIVADSWETEREQIQSLIDATAAAVEANDHQLAVQVIGDPDTRHQALVELPNYEFDRVSIGSAKINIDENASPKVADVDMIASVIASDSAGRFRNQRVVRRIVLTFQKQGSEWVVIDYNHMQPGGQPDAFSPHNVVGQRSSIRN